MKILGVFPGELEAIAYEGTLKPEQISAVAASMRKRRSQQFLARLGLTETMPSWTHSYLKSAPMALDQYLPPGVDPEGELPAMWKELAELLAWTRTKYHPIITLSIIQDHESEDWTPLFREYASMIAAYEGGYWKNAKGHAQRVLRDYPDHEAAREVRLACSARLTNDGKSTWALASSEFEGDPTNPAPMLLATRLLMEVGLADESAVFLEDSSLPDDLKARCLRLLALRDGPQTDGMMEHSFGQLRMVTDVDQTGSAEVGEFLTREVGRATTFLPEDFLNEEIPLNLFLFSSQWDYEAFAHELLGTAHTSAAGFYSGELDAVVLWRHPDQATFETSMRREMMIHIGKRVHPGFPVWMGVGLAQIVANRNLRPGMLTGQLPQQAKNRCIKVMDQGLIPLTVMLRMTDTLYHTLDAEMEMENQAWSLSFILMVLGDTLGVEVLEDLVEGPAAGKTWSDTVADLIGRAQGGGTLDERYHDLIKAFSN